MIPNRVVAAALSLGFVAVPASAQTAETLITSGVQAYENLDFDAAARLLRRAFAVPSGDSLTTAMRAQGLVYLGASEIFRGNSDTAQAVFGRLVRLDPRHRIDQFVFPPEVATVFETVRRRTIATVVEVPSSTSFSIGAAGLHVRVYSSSVHTLSAEVLRRDGTLVRTLYAGPIGDSLMVDWDGRANGGAIVPPGRYLLSTASLDANGTVARAVRVPLDVEVAREDTLPLPDPPADSLLLPERRMGGPGIEALAGGVVLGAAVIGLSSALVPASELAIGRYTVGLSIGIAGIFGFLQQRPGRPLVANIEANDRLRARWRAERLAIERENAGRLSNVAFTIRAAAAQVIDRGQ
ncbi:MAG TPA: hypothetical protein VGA37_11320 [Gemmatimonadales bacterium]